MGFVQRAFTPPGTGGREAAAIQAQTDLAAANAKVAQAAKAPPQVPTIAAAPPAPPTFAPGQSPGAKQTAKITATSMLGAAAASGQTARKSLLGQ
jgi:hypothetical protein